MLLDDMMDGGWTDAIGQRRRGSRLFLSSLEEWDCVVVEVEFCGEITRQSPVLVFYIPGGCCNISMGEMRSSRQKIGGRGEVCMNSSLDVQLDSITGTMTPPVASFHLVRLSKWKCPVKPL